MTRKTADLLLLLAALIWGIAFLFQKSALTHVGPLTFVAGRSFIAVMVLAPIAWHWQRTRASTDDAIDVHAIVKIGVAGGVLFFLGAILQQIGLITASVSNTGFLTGLYIIFTPLITWGLWQKWPDPIIWPAALIALVGTFFLGGGGLEGFGRGDALVAVGAIFWAAHLVATGGASRLGNAALFTSVQFLTVGLLAAIGAFAFETITIQSLTAAWREFLFVGILSSALTFTLLTVAMKHTGSAEAAIIVSLETVVAAIAAHIVLGERLGTIGIFGAGLMFLATVMVQVPGPFQRLLQR